MDPDKTSAKIPVAGSKIGEIEITHEFAEAWEALENSPHTLFLTGEAGTGKSTLVKLFLKQTKKRVVVLAPTGIAAINVGGQTIHSFFRFPIRILSHDFMSRMTPERAELYKYMDILLIDEISMVRADLLDAMDIFLRKHGPEPGAVFGGVKVVFVGDLNQLPPVLTEEEKWVYGQLYSGPYFFYARAFARNPPKLVYLSKVFRQNDPHFLNILNNIRAGKVDGKLVRALNERHIGGFDPSRKDGLVMLCSRNSTVDEINSRKLAELPGPSRSYSASLHGNFNQKNFPTDSELELKIGAKVVFLRNDPQRRWVNGTIGTVLEMGEKKVKVQTGKEVYEIGPVSWEQLKYDVNAEKEKIDSSTDGTFTQLPLRLAWAVTVHKSQGQTFDKVWIDLGFRAFAHGQTYVALSRCRSLQGIYLRRSLRREDFILDPEIVNFLAGRFKFVKQERLF